MSDELTDYDGPPFDDLSKWRRVPVLAERTEGAELAARLHRLGLEVRGLWLAEEDSTDGERLGRQIEDIADQVEALTSALPARGDAVEAWLREHRNRFLPGVACDTLDDVLEDYRLHADYGAPLSEFVLEPPREGGVVGGPAASAGAVGVPDDAGP